MDRRLTPRDQIGRYQSISIAAHQPACMPPALPPAPSATTEGRERIPWGGGGGRTWPIYIYMYTYIYIYIYLYIYIYILYALRESRRGHWRLCGPEAWCPQDLQGVSGGPWGFMEGLGGPWGSMGGPWGSLGAPLRVLGGPQGVLGCSLGGPSGSLGGPWGSLGVSGSSLKVLGGS